MDEYSCELMSCYLTQYVSVFAIIAIENLKAISLNQISIYAVCCAVDF